MTISFEVAREVSFLGSSDAKSAIVSTEAAAVSESEISPHVPLPATFVIKSFTKVDMQGILPRTEQDTPSQAALFPTFVAENKTLASKARLRAWGTQNGASIDFSLSGFWQVWSVYARRAGLAEEEIQACRPVDDKLPTSAPGAVALFLESVSRMSDINDDEGTVMPHATFPDTFGQLVLPVVSRVHGRPTVELQGFPYQPEVVVEQHFRVSVFPTRYGVGRTIQSMTLLPGEQQELRLKTWRSMDQVSSTASNVIDSFSDSSKESFQNELDSEQAAGSTEDSRLSWDVKASASASFFGMATASVSGGASGETRAASNESVKAVSKALRNHVDESNRQRKAELTTKEDFTLKEGEEFSSTRIIKNINLRRTLNFVFRELNQVFETIIHLEDIRTGVASGAPGDIATCSLPEARTFFQKDGDRVVIEIVRNFAVAFDEIGTPVQVLQAIKSPTWAPLADDQEDIGELPRPVADIPVDPNWSSPKILWRFKRAVKPKEPTIAERDAIGQTGDGRKVPGLVVSRDEVVLKTPGIIVEALIGHNEALDEFAMSMQRETAREKELANDRTALAIKIASETGDKAEAFAKVFFGATSKE